MREAIGAGGVAVYRCSWCDVGVQTKMRGTRSSRRGDPDRGTRDAAKAVGERGGGKTNVLGAKRSGQVGGERRCGDGVCDRSAGAGGRSRNPSETAETEFGAKKLTIAPMRTSLTGRTADAEAGRGRRNEVAVSERWRRGAAVDDPPSAARPRFHQARITAARGADGARAIRRSEEPRVARKERRFRCGA